MHAQPHPATTLVAAKDGQQFESAIEFNNFADGDAHCLITDTEHISGANIAIRHFLYPNQNEQIVRLLLLLNTLQDLGAKSVSVFVPYLPYARQDKAHVAGESISSSILCRLLKQSGCNDLYTVDCHFMKGAPETTIEGLNIHNILVQGMLIEKLQTINNAPYHIIGPDDGSAYLANGETMKKARSNTYGQYADGAIHRDVETLDDKHLTITDKTLVVADDMVSTGSTMIKALEALKARGVPHLYAMTSHGLFLKGSLEKIQENTSGVIYSDTITREDAVPVVDELFKKIAQDL
jgi:ribose-phosphate pyrophosphokinase